MITKIQTPSAVNAYRQFPLEGTGVQTDPFDWYTKATVVDMVSTVTVVGAGDYDFVELYYNAKLTASQLYTFSIGGVDDMSTTATIYYEGTQVAQSVFDDMEWTWGLSYTPDTTGTYLIKISTYSYGSAGTLSVTPVPGEITPWIEKASGVFESTGFDTLGVSERKYSFREQRLLLPNDLYVTGANTYAQLGMGNQTTVNTFTLNPYASAFKKVSSGFEKTMAIDQYGYLWAWGTYEYSGSAGSPIPIQIGIRDDWKDVYCGFNNTASFTKALLLDNNDRLWKTEVWDGVFTEVVLGKKISKLIHGIGGWDPGAYGVIDVDGGMWFAGKNNYGMFGFGDSDNRAVMTKQAGEWIDASFGGFHTLAINSNGTLWAAGNNSDGQLGQGNSVNSGSGTHLNVFTQIGVATNWVKVFATSYSSFAVNALGEVYAWGSNSSGQLGLNDKIVRTTPAKVGDYNTDILISGRDAITLLMFEGNVYVAGTSTYIGLTGEKLVFTDTGISNCIDMCSGKYEGSFFALVRISV